MEIGEHKAGRTAGLAPPNTIGIIVDQSAAQRKGGASGGEAARRWQPDLGQEGPRQGEKTRLLEWRPHDRQSRPRIAVGLGSPRYRCSATIFTPIRPIPTGC